MFMKLKNTLNLGQAKCNENLLWQQTTASLVNYPKVNKTEIFFKKWLKVLGVNRAEQLSKKHWPVQEKSWLDRQRQSIQRFQNKVVL